MSYGNEDDLEYETYLSCDDLEGKTFYQEKLELLRRSVICGDIQKFKKMAKLLGRIYEFEKEDRILSYHQVDHALSRPNILLLVCEHPQSQIFELISSNYCNILHWSAPCPPISPTDQNAEGKNAYFYGIRSNSISMLRFLIEKWPFKIDDDQLDLAVSKAYASLMLQGVKLSDDTKNFVEYSLTRARLKQCIFGNIEQGKGNPQNIDQKLLMDVKMRCLFLVDCITDLVSSHKNNAREVDEKTLYSLKVITINVYVLKGRLRCTYDRLPWEEVEFCLVTFIRHFKSIDESGIFYRSYVNKENTFNYLWELSVELSKIVETLTSADLIKKVKATREEIVADISSKSSTFEELYETHRNVQDFYSLQTILHSLTFTLSSSKPENMAKTEEVLLIERCLHVLGESMKSTKESPNLSQDLSNFISECFSDYLNKALQEIRDCLSHHDKLRRRMDTSHDNFMRIEHELTGITAIIEKIVKHVQYTKWQDICDGAKTIKSSEELWHLKELLNYEHTVLLDNGYIGQSQRQTSALMDVFMKFKTEVLRIQDDLQEKLDEAEKYLYQLSRQFSLNDGIKKLLLVILNFIEKLDVQTTGESIRPKVDYLEHAIQLGTLKISKLQALKPSDGFHVSVLLGDIIDKCMSSNTLKNTNLVLYQKNICSLLLVGEKDLMSVLNFHNYLSKKKVIKKNNNSERSKNSKNDRDNSGIIPANKSNEALLEKMLIVKVSHLKMILEKYNVEDNFESVNSFIVSHGNKKIFKVLEMLLLDVLSIYDGHLNSNTGLFDSYFPTLLGRELRNYLAHGNPAFEILGFNIKLCVVANCVAIVNQNPKLGAISKEIRSQQDVDGAIQQFHFNLSLIETKIDFFEELKTKPRREIVNHPGTDILARSMKGFTVLHAAAHNPDVEVFNDCILKMGEQADLYDSDNIFKQNLIHVAAKSNNLKIIVKILETPNSWTLLKRFDYKGYTPLHYASSFGTTDMVKLLLRHYQKGVYIRSQNNVATITNWRTLITVPTVRPIHNAIESNRVDIFKILLDHERDLSEELTDELPSIGHLAAQQGNPEFVKILIQRSVNVNMKHVDGLTPLHIACDFGRLENVKLLVSNNADLNAPLVASNQTPIAFAIANNHTDVVQYLLARDLDLHYVDKRDHRSLLHTVSEGAGPDIIESLIERGVDPNSRLIEGTTVLLFAVKKGNYAAAKTFLKHNLNVNTTDCYGCTPLHFAALNNDKEMFKLLYKHKAKYNVPDTLFGVTPVEIVLLQGSTDMKQMLVDLSIFIYDTENWKWVAYNRDINVIRTFFKECDASDIKKSTADLSELLFIAIIINNTSLFKYLIEIGANIDHTVETISHLVKPLQSSAPFFSMELAKKFKLSVRPLDLAIAVHNLDIILILLEEYMNHENKSYCFSTVQACEIFYGRRRNDNALTEITKCIIEHGDVEKCREQLLKSAVVNNNGDALKMLLDLKFNINLEIVVIAMELGHMGLCKLLIDKGKINLKSKLEDGSTILHAAVRLCDTSVVELLIRKRCDVNAKDNKGYTPIDYAAGVGEVPAVEILLDVKADMGMSILEAIDLDNTRIVNMLCESGAHLKDYGEHGSPLHYAILKGARACIEALLTKQIVDICAVDAQGFVMLHVAAQVGDLHTTKTLVGKGASAHSECEKNFKPIHYAARQGHLNIVQYYIENEGISPTETTSNGRSLLHFASCNTNVELIKFLLQTQVHVNNINDYDMTALHFAAKYSSWQVCSLLIDSGAKYNAKDKENRTPYDLANEETKPRLRLIESYEKAFRTSGSVLLKFLEANHSHLNLNARFDEGSAPLHIFVRQQNEQIVKKLLGYKADPNVLDSKSNTPLHYAVLASHVETARALLSAGAIYNLQNSDNLTAIELATNELMRRELSLIDECFQCLEEKQTNFLELLRSVGAREDQIRIIFGPKNPQNQSLYTYIVKHEMESLRIEVEAFLKENQARNEAAWRGSIADGEYKTAADILLRDLREYEEEFGPNNPLTLEMRRNLLEIWFRLKNFQICMRQNEEIIKALIELYGENNEEVLASRSFHAAIIHELGHRETSNDEKVLKYEEALEICEDVCEKQVQTLGPSHEGVLLSKSRKGRTLKALGRYKEALEIQQEVYNERKRKYGEDHPATLTSYGDIGSVLIDLGHFTEATEIFDALYSKRRLILGPMHDETLNSFSRYIETLIVERKFLKATNEMKAMYECLTTVLGTNHPRPIKMIEMFAESLWTIAGSAFKNIHSLLETKFEPLCFSFTMLRKEATTAKSNHELKSLFDAIREGNCAIVLWMMETNRNLVNTADEARATPLHLAVECNNLQIFSSLRATGADPLLLNMKRQSILHVAVKYGYVEMTRMIICHIQKSFPNELSDFLDTKTLDDEETVLHIAAKRNSYEICLFLLEKGAIYDSLNKSQQRPVDLTSDGDLKELFNIISTIFEAVERHNNSKKIIEIIRQVPPDRIEALKYCRNFKNKTTVQCALLNFRKV